MTTKYLAGGKFGDFIHSLSVVCEHYLQTGKKGILYLSNNGTEFSYGIETTYQDTKDFVLLQNYIHSYHIYKEGDTYDVDLSKWRNCDYVSKSYPLTMNDYYSITWGKHKWLENIPKDPRWDNKIVISTIRSRFPVVLKWGRFFLSEKDCVFISFNPKEYDIFCATTYLKPQFYQPTSLMEVCCILNSCRCFAGSYSGFMALAFALHTKCFVGEFGPGEIFCSDFEKVLPDVHVDFWFRYFPINVIK